ncbi:unnamed protein product, partial [Vitis vinifera]
MCIYYADLLTLFLHFVFFFPFLFPFFYDYISILRLLTVHQSFHLLRHLFNKISIFNSDVKFYLILYGVFV